MPTEKAIANLFKAIEDVLHCKFEKRDVLLMCTLSEKFKETTDKLYAKMCKELGIENDNTTRL